jgi:Leucine-rich repeat (LRR) protein
VFFLQESKNSNHSNHSISSGNDFVDLDPSIGNLTQLETACALDWNPQLRNIPTSIGNLQKLKELRIGWGYYGVLRIHLWCADYKLSSSAPVILPDEIGSLAELTTLQINCTTIKSLPESITQLPKLQSLNLNYNQLEELPEHFGDLWSSLTGALSMVSNNIGLLPEGFWQLVNIRDLDLSNNSLTGWLSSDFGNMTNLRTIKITETQLDRLPDSFGNLANLWKWEFHANKLKTLPASFKNLSSLTYLNIAQNPLNEWLPDDFGNLANLTTLGLENTDLTSLPSSFGNLPLTRYAGMCQSACTKTWVLYAMSKPYRRKPGCWFFEIISSHHCQVLWEWIILGISISAKIMCNLSHEI